MEFPSILKRSFKQPKDSVIFVYELESVATDPEVIETDEKRELSTTFDVFYRPDKAAPWKYGYSFKKKERHQKYPCIGGPLVGQTAIIGTTDYVAYNCADNRRWLRPAKYPRNVLVHKSLLPSVLQL